MANNVLPFRGGTPKEQSKIQTTPQDGPIIETTLAENFAIKKFLRFVLTDVDYQTEKIKEAGLSKKKLEESIFMSGFLKEYLSILLEEVETAIKVVQEKQ